MAARRRASAGLRVVTGCCVAVYSHKRQRRRHRRGTDEPPPSLSCGRHFARTGRRVQNNDRVGGARNHDRRPGKGRQHPRTKSESPLRDREDGYGNDVPMETRERFPQRLGNLAHARFPHSHNRSPSYWTGKTKQNRTAINPHSVSIAAPVRW